MDPTCYMVRKKEKEIMQPGDFSDWLLSLSAGFSRFIQIAMCVSTCKCLVICIYLLGCAGSSLWQKGLLLELAGFSSCGTRAKLSCGMRDLISLTRD